MSDISLPRPAAALPPIRIETLEGRQRALDASGWKLIIVYRGAHCPMCRMFLTALAGKQSAFLDAGVEVLAISADTPEKARPFIESVGFSGPVGVNLSLADMNRLGLYVTGPSSASGATAPHAEPAFFVTGNDGHIVMLGRSNTPAGRPDLDLLLAGIQYTKANPGPVSGTFAATAKD